MACLIKFSAAFNSVIEKNNGKSLQKVSTTVQIWHVSLHHIKYTTIFIVKKKRRNFLLVVSSKTITTLIYFFLLVFRLTKIEKKVSETWKYIPFILVQFYGIALKNTKKKYSFFSFTILLHWNAGSPSSSFLVKNRKKKVLKSKDFQPKDCGKNIEKSEIEMRINFIKHKSRCSEIYLPLLVCHSKLLTNVQ